MILVSNSVFKVYGFTTKIMDSFIGKVVRKDLAFLVKGGLPVPTYVLEYLLGQYCASDDEEVITEGIERVKQVIQTTMCTVRKLNL